MSKLFTENAPIYLQLMEIFKVSIVAGVFKKDDRLPPVRELASQYGVNPNTVQRAYSELEREGIVESDRTAGRYIRIDDEGIARLKKEISDGYIAKLFERMRKIGLSDQEIKSLVNDWKEEN